MLHLERLVGIHGREVGELGAVLDLLGVQSVDRAEPGQPGKLVVRAHGAKRAGNQVAGAQPGRANQLRGNEGVIAAWHVPMNADVAEPLVVHVEDALDVAEPLGLRLGLRGGRVHDLNQLGLLDARGVVLVLAGLLAQLRVLDRGELLAREGGLCRGEPVVALLAVLLLALATLSARIRLGGRLIAALGTVAALAVATGLMAATGLLDPRLRGSGGGGGPVGSSSSSRAFSRSSATFIAESSSRVRVGSAGANRLLRCLRFSFWRSRRSRRASALEDGLSPRSARSARSPSRRA